MCLVRQGWCSFLLVQAERRSLGAEIHDGKEDKNENQKIINLRNETNTENEEDE